jgi:hypothetical protein
MSPASFQPAPGRLNYALRNFTRDGQFGFANNAYNAFMRNRQQPFAATLE